MENGGISKGNNYYSSDTSFFTPSLKHDYGYAKDRTTSVATPDEVCAPCPADGSESFSCNHWCGHLGDVFAGHDGSWTLVSHSKLKKKQHET